MCNYNCLTNKIKEEWKRGQLAMNCNNKKIGCYHDNSIHFEGNGKCLVKFCKCEKYQERG